MKRFYVPVIIGKEGYIATDANTPEEAKELAFKKAKTMSVWDFEDSCVTFTENYIEQNNPYKVVMTEEKASKTKEEYFKEVFNEYLYYGDLDDVEIITDFLKVKGLSHDEIVSFLEKVNDYIQKRVHRANISMRHVALYLKHNKEAFAYMDLKLHDVAFYCGSEDMDKQYPLVTSNIESYLLFDDFCNLSYEMFVENLKEIHCVNFEKMIRHLGHTSQFTLHDREIIELVKGDIDISTTMYNFLEEEIAFPVIDVTDNNLIEYSPDVNISELLDQLEYIENNLYNDVKNYCKDIIKVYSLIDEFKGNQVTCFKEYLENEEVWLQDKKEKAEAEERLKTERRNQIIAKYGISDEDLKFLA